MTAQPVFIQVFVFFIVINNHHVEHATQATFCVSDGLSPSSLILLDWHHSRHVWHDADGSATFSPNTSDAILSPSRTGGRRLGIRTNVFYEIKEKMPTLDLSFTAPARVSW